MVVHEKKQDNCSIEKILFTAQEEGWLWIQSCMLPSL